MRPLELTIDGFRSYRTEETFAFEGRTLFGIVGPTGAGKSSILDAIIYALYGKTPHLEKETRRLINSSAEEARVRLVFEVDGSPWEVTRVIRNRGVSPVVLRRYGDDSLEKTGATAATNRIVELIGLDFNAFCSSVTLPQGEFDRFLTATPAERTRILKRIFRLERVDAMRELAKTRLGEIQFEAAALEARLESLPEDPQAILDQLRTRLEETKERAEALKEAALEVAGAEHELGRVGDEAERADLRIGELRRISADLPEPAAVQSLWEEEDAARRAVASQQEKREKADADLKLREETLRRAEAELAPGLTRARELTRDRSRAEDRLKVLSGTESELAKAVKDHEQARLAAVGAVERAESELADAARKLLEVHTSHAAHLLRRDLKPGDPCPVCEQEVVTVPKGARPPVVAAAEKQKTRCERARDQATRALAGLDRSLAAEAARLEGVVAETARVKQESSAMDSEIEQLFGKGADPAAEIARREETLATSSKSVVEARKVLGELERAASQTRSAYDTIAVRRQRMASILIQACVKLKVEPPSFEDDAAALLGSAKRAREEVALAIEAAEKLRRELGERAGTLTELLASARARHGLGPEESFSQALAAANEAVGSLAEQISAAEKAVRQKAEAGERLKEIEGSRGIYRRLAADLTDAKFTDYLLNEQRRLLASLGSEKLLQLTGRYRFDDEGEFEILDVALGVSRSPDTLSGGETFLASLALALALAEAVVQGGSRLECFFLDEGFGSLDAASLELALDAIEGLARPGRLIGLISHVPTIQARIDDLIVLDKTQEGSTIVAQKEGPLGYQISSV